jgi:hypothetical protein
MFELISSQTFSVSRRLNIARGVFYIFLHYFPGAYQGFKDERKNLLKKVSPLNSPSKTPEGSTLAVSNFGLARRETLKLINYFMGGISWAVLE